MAIKAAAGVAAVNAAADSSEQQRDDRASNYPESPASVDDIPF